MAGLGRVGSEGWGWVELGWDGWSEVVWDRVGRVGWGRVSGVRWERVWWAGLEWKALQFTQNTL